MFVEEVFGNVNKENVYTMSMELSSEAYDYAASVCGGGILLATDTVNFVDGTSDDELTFALELYNGVYLVYSYNSTNGISSSELLHEDSIWPIVPKWEIKRGRMPKGQFVDNKGVRRYKSIYSNG